MDTASLHSQALLASNRDYQAALAIQDTGRCAYRAPELCYQAVCRTNCQLGNPLTSRSLMLVNAYSALVRVMKSTPV